jgi:rhodanese-related sulfurtransferase
MQALARIIKSGKRPREDYLVVDVRDSDFIGGNITNCRNAPSDTFSDNLDDLVRETKNVPQVIFHCALSQSRWVMTTRLVCAINHGKV